MIPTKSLPGHQRLFSLASFGLANTAGDTVRALKQAREFGIPQAGQRLAAMVFFVTDVHSIGLSTAQGTLLVTSFYWD